MSDAYSAKTNKDTWLMRPIKPSVLLPAGTPVIAYREHVNGAWIDVSCTPTGETQPSHGMVLIADIT